jgi:hypothetical protein
MALAGDLAVTNRNDWYAQSSKLRRWRNAAIVAVCLTDWKTSEAKADMPVYTQQRVKVWQTAAPLSRVETAG